MGLCLDDKLVWTPEYKLLPQNALDIPSLHMMGSAKFKRAWEPLQTHYHNTVEIVVVFNGNQQYIVNEATYLLRGGNMFLTYPNEIHGNGTRPQNVCEFIWFQLDLTQKSGFLGLPEAFAQQLYHNIANCKKRTMDVSIQDLEQLQRAWIGLSSMRNEDRLIGYTSLLNFLVVQFSKKEAAEDERTISPDMQLALRYIHANLTNDFTIADISAACNISESRFKAKFKLQMGITPLSYINTIKIDRAKDLLQKTEKPITEIAFELNFSSSNYFASVFNKYTGYSPSEFRQEKFHTD